MRGVVHRLELEIGLQSRLAQMLVRKRRDGIDARAGLHRRGLVLVAAVLLIGSVDLALDGALLFRRALGLRLEVRR